jgi:hypothetical protein
MAKVTVTSAGVQILDGTQTVNTLVTVGSTPIRHGTGTIGARPFDDLSPLGAGQYIIFPPGVRVTLYCGTSDNYAIVHTEGFGV